jgi:predicted nucleic acid-binding Zn ribbon protein
MSNSRRKTGRGDNEFEELQDLERRRASHQRWFNAKQPKPIGNVIAQLVQRKGYAQVRAAGERDEAWQEAVGEQLAPSTRVGGIRRGVFEVFVANSLMMQELTFRKEELLTSLQNELPDEGIKQLRFRLGSIE